MGLLASNQEVSLYSRLDMPREMKITLHRFRDLEKATRINEQFMINIIRTRREELAAGAAPQSDILSLMIQSAESEGKLSMTDSELVRTSPCTCALTN